jgi:hypothetical protein
MMLAVEWKRVSAPEANVVLSTEQRADLVAAPGREQLRRSGTMDGYLSGDPAAEH